VDADEFPTTVADGSGFIRITLSGSTNRVRRLRLLDRIFAETAARGVHRVLVDSLTTTGEISTVERYEFGEEAARVLGSSTKVAIVIERARADRFAETVARNRGGNIGIFTSEADALEWLVGSGVRAPLG
jgi:hypothetical protein